MPVDRAAVEKRILGLGSPKFDKIQNTRKEDLEIPGEWLSVIQKPDGTPKKIILYNTGVAALLRDSDRMLGKIREVLRIFQEHRREVALLWRPHPLIAQTIAARRPALQQEYAAIVQQYRKDGWGIYDDSPDLDRAIILSDAYYGDPSSVVQLCQKAGMPVMIQNARVP
jgi:CDP-glycerol glycerophosphotransferase (TagB/SpsB family)